MKKQLRDDWCAALRSGKYKQGEGLLRSANDEYCCLGVLCDVDGAEWDLSGLGFYRADPTHGATALLTQHFRSRAHLSRDTEAALTNLNDEEGKTFSEIADWIEANIEVEP